MMLQGINIKTDFFVNCISELSDKYAWYIVIKNDKIPLTKFTSKVVNFLLFCKACFPTIKLEAYQKAEKSASSIPKM